MKNRKIILVIALMAMAAFYAYGQQSDPESNFKAAAVGGGRSVMITEYVGDNWTVRIPERIRQLPVTHIGVGAFYEKNLISVTIPNSVTHIGEYAFVGNQLTSVSIPNSVTHIGDLAFFENPLTSITFEGNGLRIGDNNGILTVLYERGGAGTYTRNDDSKTWTMMTSITIPNGVTRIEDEEYADRNLTSVTIPNSVTHIGREAFTRNQLASVTIGNSVTNIGAMAFLGNRLTSVTIPNSVTVIRVGAFSNNPLTSVTFGRSGVEIGDAFDGKLADAYARGGAGRYTRPNASSTNWTKN